VAVFGNDFLDMTPKAHEIKEKIGKLDLINIKNFWVGLVWWFMLVIPVTWEVEVGGSYLRPGPGKNMRTYLKNN
jgi:hypothetical protein